MSTGNYSKFSTFSLKKRCFIMQAQRNVPLLDSEVRELSETSVALVNWLARNSYGDVAVLTQPYSDPDGSSTNLNKAFGCGPVDSPQPGNTDFKVFGGRNSDGNNESPAVMYLKGWYVFLNTDVLYSDQGDDLSHALSSVIKEFPGESLPSDTDTAAEKLKFALRSDTYTKTTAAALGSSTVGAYDLIYLEITFDEVTGTDKGGRAYSDPSLIDPTLGSQTANRIRATLNIRVQQNWGADHPDSSAFSKDGGFTGAIFDHDMFKDGKYPETGVSYIRTPIAYVKRESANYYPSAQKFTDLLELYNRRIFTPKELTYRMLHGGFTLRDIKAGVTGAKLDETWDAIGQNKGQGPEALNTDAVTPRVLQKSGKFQVRSQVVGNSSESIVEPNPESLETGEQAASATYTDKSFIRGNTSTGITQAREWLEDAIQVVDVTGTSLAGQIWHTSAKKLDDSGDDAKGSAWVQKYHSTEDMPPEVVSELDYQGRLALGRGVDPSRKYHLDVSGGSRFSGGVEIVGSLSLTGNQSIDGDLAVFGEIESYTLVVDNDTLLKGPLIVHKSAELKDTLLVGGEVTLQDNLYVTKDTSTDTLTVRNGAIIGGSLTVEGSTTVNNNLTINGVLTANPPSGTSLDNQVVTVGYLTNFTTTTVGNYLLRDGKNTMEGNIVFSDPGIDTFRGVRGTVGANDVWRVGGGATSQDGGYLEIATTGNGSEPIYVRQYTGDAVPRELTLLDANGRTWLPHDLNVAGSAQVIGGLEAKSLTVEFTATARNLTGTENVSTKGYIHLNGGSGIADQVLTSGGQGTGGPLPAVWKTLTNMGLDSWGLLSSNLRKRLGSMVTGTLNSFYMGWNAGAWQISKTQNPRRVLSSTLYANTGVANPESWVHRPDYIVGEGYVRSVSLQVAAKVNTSGSPSPIIYVNFYKYSSSDKGLTLFMSRDIRFSNTGGNDSTAWVSAGQTTLRESGDACPSFVSTDEVYVEFGYRGDDGYISILSYKASLIFTAAPYNGDIT